MLVLMDACTSLHSKVGYITGKVFCYAVAGAGADDYDDCGDNNCEACNRI